MSALYLLWQKRTEERQVLEAAWSQRITDFAQRKEAFNKALAEAQANMKRRQEAFELERLEYEAAWREHDRLRSVYDKFTVDIKVLVNSANCACAPSEQAPSRRLPAPPAPARSIAARRASPPMSGGCPICSDDEGREPKKAKTTM
jgi:hypothetical protein